MAALGVPGVWGCGSNVQTATPDAVAAVTTSGAGGATGVTASSSAASGTGGSNITCPASPLPKGVSHQMIAFGGLMRAYDVQIPASYANTTAVPLVFDLHGYTSNKEQQQAISGWSALAEKEGFVVVRPDGFQNSWNGGNFCCGEAQAKGLDDVGLMRAIAAEVQKRLCIDPKRIYFSGLSNGGAMSHRVACEAGDLFAMTAPVSYPLDFKPLDKCKPSRPMPVMHFHGTNDLIVPYNGGAFAIPAKDSFAYWAKADGCTGTPTKTYEKGASHCDTYTSCQGGATVTLCTLNGGHLLYANADDVPIAELAWAEMKKHPLP
jgi:polyhydroxybutyrate depolymerase